MSRWRVVSNNAADVEKWAVEAADKLAAAIKLTLGVGVYRSDKDAASSFARIVELINDGDSELWELLIYSGREQFEQFLIDDNVDSMDAQIIAQCYEEALAARLDKHVEEASDEN
jgi:hypothetical protein